jgi:hypothetical protein
MQIHRIVGRVVSHLVLQQGFARTALRPPLFSTLVDISTSCSQLAYSVCLFIFHGADRVLAHGVLHRGARAVQLQVDARWLRWWMSRCSCKGQLLKA